MLSWKNTVLRIQIRIQMRKLGLKNIKGLVHEAANMETSLHPPAG